jgi:hypothetical protein
MARTKRLRSIQLSHYDNFKKDKERTIEVTSRIVQAVIIGMCLSMPAMLATNQAVFFNNSYCCQYGFDSSHLRI